MFRTVNDITKGAQYLYQEGSRRKPNIYDELLELLYVLLAQIVDHYAYRLHPVEYFLLSGIESNVEMSLRGNLKVNYVLPVSHLISQQYLLCETQYCFFVSGQNI
jgi:hypothetical protein